jgi:hypothetical protein
MKGRNQMTFANVAINTDLTGNSAPAGKLMPIAAMQRTNMTRPALQRKHRLSIANAVNFT